MSNRLTRWFSSSKSLPARAGVYQARTRGTGKTYYSYFDGMQFYGCWRRPEKAMAMGLSCGPNWWSTIVSWRGLAKKP
jgi:hypothetical protein